MPVEGKVNNLKRSYPNEEQEQQRKETESVLTNVASLLKSTETSQEPKVTFVQSVTSGQVPPPNTPCTKD
ncbi:unnamed protein product [Caenorhabditis sp. 36 PRJEB53466]|nr:unnamed protein product [Caenorhabditis sp. 36 PRJEB53466]